MSHGSRSASAGEFDRGADLDRLLNGGQAGVQCCGCGAGEGGKVIECCGITVAQQASLQGGKGGEHRVSVPSGFAVGSVAAFVFL